MPNDNLHELCKKTANWLRCHRLMWTPRTMYWIGVQILPREGAILSGKACPTTADDTLTWAVHKWLNRSRCHLGCGLRLAKGSMCFYTGAHWCHMANTTELSMCGIDAALCQINLTTCLVYRPHGQHCTCILQEERFAFSALTLLVGWHIRPHCSGVARILL